MDESVSLFAEGPPTTMPLMWTGTPPLLSIVLLYVPHTDNDPLPVAASLSCVKKLHMLPRWNKHGQSIEWGEFAEERECSWMGNGVTYQNLSTDLSFDATVASLSSR